MYFVYASLTFKRKEKIKKEEKGCMNIKWENTHSTHGLLIQWVFCSDTATDALAEVTSLFGAARLLPELLAHDGGEAAVDLATCAELMQVAPGLRKDDVSRHGLGEGVEEHHQFIDVHASIDRFLAVHGHDGDADEEVEGGGLVVGPAGLPDGEGVVLGEFPLQADQEPAVAEHQREPALRLLQVTVE